MFFYLLIRLNKAQNEVKERKTGFIFVSFDLQYDR